MGKIIIIRVWNLVEGLQLSMKTPNGKDIELKACSKGSYTSLQDILNGKSELEIDGVKIVTYLPQGVSYSDESVPYVAVIQFGSAKVVVCGDVDKDSMDQLMQQKGFRDVVSNASILIPPFNGTKEAFHEDFMKVAYPHLLVVHTEGKEKPTGHFEYWYATKGYHVFNVDSQIHENKVTLLTGEEGNMEFELSETKFADDTPIQMARTHCKHFNSDNLEKYPF